jgi:adenine-specific DNA-methyltransferase
MFGGYYVSITRFYSDRVSQKINEFNQKAMANSKKKFTPIEMSVEGLEAIEMVSLDCTTDEQTAPWHSDAEIKIERNSFVTHNGVKSTEFWDGKIHSDEKPLRMKIRNICGDETILTL